MTQQRSGPKHGAGPQVVGTFHSYHQAPPQSVFSLLASAPYQAVFTANKQNIPTRLAFTHQTLTQQLNAGALNAHSAWGLRVAPPELRRAARAGIRGFEIDTQADPGAGGKYAYSAGLKLAGVNNTLISPDLLQPGIKARAARLTGGRGACRRCMARHAPYLSRDRAPRGEHTSHSARRMS